MPTEEDAERVEKLARRIAGNTADLATLEHARNAAEAEFELARVRKVKVALIEGMFAFGAPEVPKLSIPCTRSAKPNGFWMRSVEAKKTLPKPTRQQRSRQAQQRCRQRNPIASPRRCSGPLPELVKLDRYERHAVRQRDRSLRAILESRNRYP